MELEPEGWFGFVALELDDGLEELDEDGVLLEPAPAEPLGLELELDGEELDDEDAPPLAWSFLLMSTLVDEELEPDGVLGVVALPPAEDDEDEPEGDVVAPEGEVEDELDERSAPRSQAAISDAPSATETATAIVESLMWPPWLGYKVLAANIGPRLLRRNPRSRGRSVLHRRFGVTARGTRSVTLLLEIAVLLGVLRVDLALRRVRAFLLLRRARRPSVRWCRRRPRPSLRRGRRRVGFRRRRRRGIAVAARDQRERNKNGHRQELHHFLRSR